MKDIFRIAVVALVFAVVLMSLACTSDSPESLSEEACNKEVQCGLIDPEDFDLCMSEVLPYAQALAEDDNCWDATVDVFECELGLSCEELSNFDALEAQCGAAYDAQEAACAF